MLDKLPVLSVLRILEIVIPLRLANQHELYVISHAIVKLREVGVLKVEH